MGRKTKDIIRSKRGKSRMTLTQHQLQKLMEITLTKRQIQKLIGVCKNYEEGWFANANTELIEKLKKMEKECLKQ